jgi:putative transposase
MAAAVGYAPDGDDAFLAFQTRPGAYNDEALIAFLQELHSELGRAKVTLIWDGLPSHRSRVMTAFVRSERRWLVVERLPGYAPDLNPVELVWGNLKSRELANLCADRIEDADQAAYDGLLRIGGDTDLCLSFLAGTGLSL